MSVLVLVKLRIVPLIVLINKLREKDTRVFSPVDQ